MRNPIRSIYILYGLLFFAFVLLSFSPDPPASFAVREPVTFYAIGNLASGNNPTDGERVITKQLTGNLAAPAALEAEIIATGDVSCSGGNDGSATVSAIGGMMPYTYLWSDGQTTPTAVGLSAGIYSVTVTDANSDTATASVSISEPAALQLILDSQTNIDCNNAQGSATVSATGGTPGYSYSWSNGQNGPSVTGLAAGTYEVTVTDSQNCTDMLTVNILLDTLPPVAEAGPNGRLVCGLPVDTLDATGSASGPGIAYQWSTMDGNILSGDTTLRPVVDATGSYFLIVIDNNTGCLSIDSTEVELIFPPVIFPDSLSDVSCGGGSDGYLSIEVLDGTPPYSINWSTGDTGLVLQNLPAAFYGVTVTDADGCTDSLDLEITEPPVLELSLAATHETSVGANDGTASVTISGGAPTYEILWSNGARSGTITGLVPGIYEVTVTDANDCSVSGSIEVLPFGCNLAISASGRDIGCAGDSTGTAWVTASNGTPPVSVTWSTGSTADTIAGLLPGWYFVTVTDGNGCVEMDSVQIDEPAPLTLHLLSLTDVDCAGNASGGAEVEALGGTASYSYLWSEGSTGNRVMNLAAGTYEVTVSDANGCTDSLQLGINQPDTLQLSLNATGETGYQSEDGTATAVASGGTAPYLFFWSSGDTSAMASGLAAGTYYLTLTDANGCALEDSVVVAAFDCDTLSVSLSGDLLICPESATGQLRVDSVSGGQAPYSYAWSNGSTGPVIIDLTAGTYFLTISDANGCPLVDSITISEQDTLPPTVRLRSDTLYLDAAGIAELSFADLDFGSFDDCGIDSVYLDISAFSCDHLGENQVGVVVMDAAGNSVMDSTIVLVLDTLAPTINCPASFTSNNCSEVEYPDPAISDNCVFLPAELIAGLPSGAQFPEGVTEVTLQTTDAGGNLAECSFTVTVSNNLSLLVNEFFDCDSTYRLTAVPNGGTPPYSIAWSTGATANSIEVGPGSYSLTITDDTGCSLADTVELAPYLPMELTDVVIVPEDNTQENGSVDITLFGGDPQFTFNWFNEAGDLISNEEDLSGIGAGVYLLQVVDARGCALNDTIIVDRISAIIDRQLDASLELFPNPAKDEVNLLLPTGTGIDYRIELFDPHGRLVRHLDNQASGRVQIDLRDLPSGLYLVRVSGKNGFAIRKVNHIIK